MAIIIDLVLVILIAGITYALISEGLWGAALMFFNILFSAVLSLNFYEPLASLLASNAPAVGPGADVAVFSVLFLVILVIMRVATEQMAPTSVRFPNIVYNIGRVVFGLAGALLTVAVLLLCFHMAPVHKKMFGSVDHNKKPPFGLGLDRRLLAFFQFSTGYPFARYSETAVNDPEFGQALVFDRQGRWLIDHEDARPFGEGWREEAGGTSPTAAEGAGSGLYDASGNAPTVPGRDGRRGRRAGSNLEFLRTGPVEASEMTWQDAATWLLVALAGAYLIRRGFTALGPAVRKAETGCGGGCGSCPSKSAAPTIVPLLPRSQPRPPSQQVS